MGLESGRGRGGCENEKTGKKVHFGNKKADTKMFKTDWKNTPNCTRC